MSAKKALLEKSAGRLAQQAWQVRDLDGALRSKLGEEEVASERKRDRRRGGSGTDKG